MFARTLISTFLIKVSKHLLLLVWLLILRRAPNGYKVSQMMILGLTIVSSLLHLVGWSLQHRAARK